jgi:nicotinamide riboside kinase
VPEYAREYLLALNRPYEQNDLLEIAKGQIASEDELSNKANRFFICDTDLHVIKVWSEAKYGSCDKWILEQIAGRKYDLYLLMDIDIEWQNDPLREHPSPEERKYFYKIYHDIVQDSSANKAFISGTHEERLKKALSAIRSMT